jgi:hypothetical protein
MQANGMNAKDYAEKVVGEVNRGTVGKYWVGGGATGAKWGSWLLPQWIIVSFRQTTILLSINIADFDSRTDCWKM